MIANKYVCLIENKAYKLDRDTLDAILDMAEKKYKKENKSAICAIEKDDIFDMKREEFTKEEYLENKIKDYEKQGFKVYYVRGIGNNEYQ